jgi:hypothetical protein
LRRPTSACRGESERQRRGRKRGKEKKKKNGAGKIRKIGNKKIIIYF